MGNSYVRQSSAQIVTGNNVEAAPLNAEFNALQNAFSGDSGHSHNGALGEGPKISLLNSVSGVLQVANGGNGGINNLTATTAPTASDDVGDGYARGSLWVNTATNVLYICLDNTAGTARWISYQEFSIVLYNLSTLTGTTVDKMFYTSGTDLYATTALTPFARTLLDDTTAAAMRTTLGLGSLATQSSSFVNIAGGTISGTTITGGSLSTNSATITGGSITGITDLAINDGGTGASTASGAKVNLGLDQVDNTSDVNKPISTATQSALNLKVDTSTVDTDGTLAANSDAKLASQRAVKTYHDVSINNLKSTVTTANDTLAKIEANINTKASLTGNETLTNKTLTSPTINNGSINNASIVLKQSTTPAPTAEGDMQWDTDDDYLAIGNGSATKIIKPNAWELIAFDSVTNVAAWVKTDLSAYKHLKLTINILGGSINVAFQGSSDNGSTYLTNVHYYLYQFGTSSGAGTTSLTGIPTFPIITGNQGTVGVPQLATVLITDFNKPRYTGIISDCFIQAPSSMVSAKVGGGIASATSLNALRVYGSGNFDGDFVLEGIKG